MATPTLIYCSDGNPKFVKIASDFGFIYGAQLPRKVYKNPEFVDQKWRKPNFEKYMAALAQYRPRLATVLDLEKFGQLARVMWWAVVTAQFVTEAVIIIPKVHGIIKFLPREIYGKQVRLGYSVPTSYGGTAVNYSEFNGWPVHLLGGSPLQQRKLTKYLNVVSCDGNYHLKMAIKWNQFFVADGSARFAKNRFWPTLREADGKSWGDGSNTADAPYEAFRRSCVAIMQMWQTSNNSLLKIDNGQMEIMF